MPAIYSWNSRVEWRNIVRGKWNRDKKREYHWQCPRVPSHQRVTAYSYFWYQINLFLSSHCQTRRESLLQPFLSRRSRATYTERRQLQTSEISDRQRGTIDVHAIGTRVISWQRIKNLTNYGVARHGVVYSVGIGWCGSVWPGVAWRGKAKCEIHHGHLRPSASASLSSFFPPSLPPFSRWLPFGLVLDNANNTAVDKGSSDRKTLSLRIWSGLTFDQRGHDHQHQETLFELENGAKEHTESSGENYDRYCPS